MNPTFFYNQNDMFNHAQDNTFFVSKTILNSKQQSTQSYTSFPSINDFILYYKTLQPQEKTFNELICDIGYRYEYYDIDIKINQEQIIRENNYEPYGIYAIKETNDSIFNVFQQCRQEFIEHIQSHVENIDNTNITQDLLLLKHLIEKLKKPQWIITSASSHEKISLHILNKNIIFTNNDTTKLYMKLFQNFLKTLDQPNLIDTNVYSKNRLMRITESTKPNQNRPLNFWNPNCSNLYQKQINPPIEHTIITSASNDLHLVNKTIYNDEITLLNTLLTGETNDRRKKEKEKEKEEKDFNNFNTPEPEDFIEQILDLLSPDRTHDMSSWISVGMALKNSGYNFYLWNEWSSHANNYCEEACKKHWKSFKSNKEKPLTIGTIKFWAKQDNPEKYKQITHSFLSTQSNHFDFYNSSKNDASSNYSDELTDIKNKYTNFKFTIDVEIHEKYISSETYSNYLNDYDTICLKSNMNTGKTFCLPNIFQKYQKIIVVYSRVSLNVNIFNKWKHHGFQLYSNIKDHIINTHIHNRVIVQIDSLHRVYGSCDLLILDEVESLHEYICGCRLLVKTSDCYHTLMNYVQHTPKLIMCDANLKDETINHFLTKREKREKKEKRREDKDEKEERKTIRIHNTYLSFDNITTRFYFCEKIFIDSIQTFVKNNKKIIIPTNSKRKAKLLEKFIIDERPDYKILRCDMENRCENVDDWKNYDVVIYTPTITAGVSFDLPHFDKVCAYFVRKSTSCEQSSQMLFRARHINDNEIHIMSPPDCENLTRPIDTEGLTNYINDKIQCGNQFLKLDGIKIDKYNCRAKETGYFNLYLSYLRKEFLSFSFFFTYLRRILQNHGSKIEYEKRELTENDKMEIRDRTTELHLEINKDDANDIINSKCLSEEEYIDLINKKIDMTKEELSSVKRYNLCKSFDKPIDEVLEAEWVITNSKYVNAVKRYKEFTRETNECIEEARQTAMEKQEESYTKMMMEKTIDKNIEDECLSSDSEDENESDKKELYSVKLDRKRKKTFIKYISQTVADSINYDRTYQKIYHCLGIIQSAGFTKVDCKKRIKPDFKKMIEYVRENEKEIRVLWGCKKNMFEGDVQVDVQVKKALMIYINAKLDECLGVKIEKNKSKGTCQEYIIKKQFII
jgi:hypothetical protein